MPFSQKEWNGMVERGRRDKTSWHNIDVFDAVAFFVRCRQSRAGSFKSFATLSRNRTRRGMNEQASAWLNAIDGLPAVHNRLKRVVILHDDALKAIRQQDGPKTLFYLDPPYVHSTRNESSIKAYEYEMSDDDHRALLMQILLCRGKVMLSGYDNDMYDEILDRAGWKRHDKLIDNKLSNDRLPVIESVWCNF
jgi:DNA adenine methylase